MSLSQDIVVNWFLDNRGPSMSVTENIYIYDFHHLHSAVFWASVCVCLCVSDRVKKRQLRGRWWWICAVTDVKEVPDRLAAAHYSVSLCRIAKAYQRCRFQRQHKHSHTDTHTHTLVTTQSSTHSHKHTVRTVSTKSECVLSTVCL